MSQLEHNSAPEVKKEFIPYWWKVVFVFSLGWAIMYADRTILNPVMPNLAAEFGLTNSQLGLLNSVFFLTYAVLQMPSGALGDKFGRKYVLVPGFILFGVFTAISGIATSFAFLLIARAITGLGEGTYYGPQYALSSDAIPKKNLTVGTAIINSGMAIGISGGYILSSYLTLEMGYSWRAPFYVMSVPTVLVGIMIWFIIREKRRTNKQVEENTTVEKEKIDWSFLKNRNIIAVLIMVFCSLYGFFMVITWLPQYLQVERGFQGSDVGFISSLIPWASIPGALIFAYLSDKLGRRKPLIFFLVPIAAISIFAVAYIQSIPLMIVALIVYGLTGKLALDPVLIAFVADNAPKKVYSTIFGIYNFVGMSSSILAPYITGAIVDVAGTMKTGFFVSMVLLGIGFVAMLFTTEKKTTV
ncbi:putative sulfoacetate transporter SauU [Paraliobacillus sp. PM-2]|uniref:MFS transporter n=1 Tax=Paraliobacillus sp. PM-2 TaxID=1462524 RepID=UPI00061C2175|nr:MFS transporter [Paraliobacillus sp. PM-2]CQR46303.1 putative sulfoacetate transporter SauU [Paraliobacillus sp. PM-2]